jgi:methyl-accepting chemotaxis protein
MVMTTLAAGALTVRSFAPVHSLAFFQAQDSINSGNSKLLMIFIGIAAFALLAQAIVMIAAGIGTMKAINEIKGHVEEMRSKALPFISSAHGLVTDMTPEVKQITAKVNMLVTDLSPEIKQITTKVHEISVKAEQITAHFEEIASMAKDKAHEFSPTISDANRTVQDANRMSKEQLIRVDARVTEALNATEEMGASLRHSISAPGREIAHLVSSAKATMSTFVNGTKASVDTMVTGTKGTMDTLVHGTKGTVDALLFGMKGLTASLFGAKQKPVTYRPAAYRSNPAVPTPPSRTGFSDEKQPLDL